MQENHIRLKLPVENSNKNKKKSNFKFYNISLIENFNSDLTKI